MAAIFRDEAPFLAEWLLFHRLVGVDHVFLYDNGSHDGADEVLRPFLEQGWVSLMPWALPFREQAARKAYQHALERSRGRFRWLACIDLDEFLFAPGERSLARRLHDYEAHPGVVVHWQCYGSSGHQHSAPDPVISRFLRRAPEDWIRNRRVKSIVDPDRTEHALGCHHFAFLDGGRAVTEDQKPVDVMPRRPWKKRLRPLYGLLGSLAVRFDPYAAREISSNSVSVERLRINHYAVRAREDYERKARLKEGKGRYDGLDYFAYHDRNEVSDPVLLDYLPAIEAELARLREQHEPPDYG